MVCRDVSQGTWEANAFFSHIGCSSGDLQCLRSKPVDDIVAAQQVIFSSPFSSLFSSPFSSPFFSFSDLILCLGYDFQVPHPPSRGGVHSFHSHRHVYEGIPSSSAAGRRLCPRSLRVCFFLPHLADIVGIVALGKFNKVPVMLGSVYEDALWFIYDAVSSSITDVVLTSSSLLPHSSFFLSFVVFDFTRYCFCSVM